MLREVNPSQAMLSYPLSTSTTYYGGKPAFLDDTGAAEPLGLTELLDGERFVGLYLTCYNEDSNYGNGYTTLVKPPCTVELYTGYSKHNYSDTYAYDHTEAWLPGDPVYIGYDYLWHRTNQCVGTAAGQVIFGTVEEAPNATATETGTNNPKGLVVYFYASPE